jgi:hypothetical protein
MLSGLENKDINLDIYEKKICKKPDLIPLYLEGLLSKNETYRYNCFKVLYAVSEKKPEMLYPHWDFFTDHLKSENDYHKMSAVLIIANLTSVDTQDKFVKIFDIFYENLKSKKTIVPIYVVKSSGKIVNFKPKLEEKITDLLLNIQNIYPGKQIELVKAAAIESFLEFFNKAKNKQKIISFVKKQLVSESPKTRKTAKEFLRKFGEIE